MLFLPKQLECRLLRYTHSSHGVSYLLRKRIGTPSNASLLLLVLESKYDNITRRLPSIPPNWRFSTSTSGCPTNAFVCVRTHFYCCIVHELCDLCLLSATQFSIFSRRDCVLSTEPVVAVGQAKSRKTFGADFSIASVSSLAGI